MEDLEKLRSDFDSFLEEHKDDNPYEIEVRLDESHMVYIEWD